MPVPKHRTSKSKRDMRRAHDALTATAQSACPNCKEVKLPHRVCDSCGYYKGVQIFEPKSKGQIEQTFDTGE
jgi:large subunit ribosomal protein L32